MNSGQPIGHSGELPTAAAGHRREPRPALLPGGRNSAGEGRYSYVIATTGRKIYKRALLVDVIGRDRISGDRVGRWAAFGGIDQEAAEPMQKRFAASLAF
jgi:hypothetical protein